MIVADAGPLISLAKIDRLSLLPAIFGRVLVATRVNAEIIVEGAPGADRLTGLPWLAVRAPADSQRLSDSTPAWWNLPPWRIRF